MNEIEKLPDNIVREVCRRSENGEGVMAILIDLGIDPIVGTDALKQHNRADIESAKKEQNRRKNAKPK